MSEAMNSTISMQSKKTSDHYSVDLDLGIDKRPFSDDLNDSERVSDIGFNKSEIYAGVNLFSALKVKRALLYINRLDIDCHPNSSNIMLDDVRYSACRIMRAACFCNLEMRLIFELVVAIHVLQP